MKFKDRSDWKEAKTNMGKMKRSSSKIGKFGFIATIIGLGATWYGGWKLGVAQTGDGLLNTLAEDEVEEKKSDVVDTTATEGES